MEPLGASDPSGGRAISRLSIEVMQKYEFINQLAKATRARRYLEICTPTTGGGFGRVDPEILSTKHRLMYNCPAGFDDGCLIDVRTTSLDSRGVLGELRDKECRRELYDIVFVDPWHTYKASFEDLCGAMSLLDPGGMIVVHDCNPESASLVAPDYQDGSWCGVTYQAFIDYVLAAESSGYCVVDADYGCGIVLGPRAPRLAGLPMDRPTPQMVADWTLASADDVSRYSFFDEHRTPLLNLVSVEQFEASLDRREAGSRGA